MKLYAIVPEGADWREWSSRQGDAIKRARSIAKNIANPLRLFAVEIPNRKDAVVEVLNLGDASPETWSEILGVAVKKITFQPRR